VPPKTPTKLAEAMLSLADDLGLRASLGRAGARRAEETFPLSAMLDKVESLFGSVLFSSKF
jgi:glycosyltransferase involved in cell wall biosynthesis